MAEQNQVVDQEVVEGKAVTPEAATVATPEKVDEGAAPAEKPIAKTYTQEEVDAIAARVAAREDRKRVREHEALVARLTAQPPVVKAETPSDPAAPKREDFDDYGEYVRADARYVARQEVRAEREADAKAQKEAKEAEDHASAERKFHERMQVAERAIPDFEDALDVAKRLPISNAMYGAIIRLEKGPELVHYFGKHPEEALRISQLHPSVHAAEIGILTTKLSAPTSQTASVSRAPEPIEPIGGKTTAVSDKPPDDSEEFKRWHDAKERAKAQARRRA